MGNNKIKEIVWGLAESSISDESHFVVDVKIGSGGPKRKLSVLLDGDQGIDIDTCAKVSRAIGHALEEDEIIDGAYTLEVSSPGIDYPFVNRRQYRKNIGRTVKVTLTDKEKNPIKGELLAVEDDFILINEEIKVKGKGKKLTFAEVQVPFSEIESTNVVLLF
ncbi:MAG: ribosome maturation factor RimP [Cytophagales bacterium]|nr:ribosome maturation factor RimP [Cytophagales bacterium]